MSSTSLNSFYSFTVCTALRKSTELFFSYGFFSSLVPSANIYSLPSLYFQLMLKLQHCYCLLTGYYTGIKKAGLSLVNSCQFLTAIRNSDFLKHFLDDIDKVATLKTTLIRITYYGSVIWQQSNISVCPSSDIYFPSFPTPTRLVFVGMQHDKFGGFFFFLPCTSLT